MKVHCVNCLPKEGIEIPDFSQSEKNKLVELIIRSPLQTTRFILDNFNLSHINAKYIVAHINKTYGHCNRCNFDKLNEEYSKCPKCRALNFNWKVDNKRVG